MSIRASQVAATAALSACLLSMGCTSLPSFERLGSYKSEADVGPTVSDLVTHIQCEIRDALLDPDHRFDDLRESLYVTYASLTLDVTNTQGLSPTLNFINPLATEGTNVTLNLGAQLSGTQHRDINETFTLVIDSDSEEMARLASEAVANRCKPLSSPRGLRGNLGIKEILAAGIRQNTNELNIFPVPKPEDSEAGKVALSGSLIPNFGYTIDFTIVYGLSGGPTWTLTHFNGPGDSFANYQRTVKDTLFISFGRVPTAPHEGKKPLKPQVRTPGHLSPVEEAATASQQHVTSMILQKLLPLATTPAR